MNEIEDVSRLIGDFYDASLDPSLWPAAFHKAAKYIGGSASYLFWQDILGESSDGYFAAGHDPHFLQLYLQQLHGARDRRTSPLCYRKYDHSRTGQRLEIVGVE